MRSAVLNQVEETISQLSRQEQLWLIEQLAHHLREGAMKRDARGKPAFKDQFVAMASDPQIQMELQKIDQEFAITEADGLAGK